MGNPENLKGKGFDNHPENINKKGRIVGSKNRSTILKELLEQSGNEQKVNQAIIDKAMGGDVRAFQEIMDTIYGKIIDKKEVETVDVIKYKNVSKQFPDKE